MVLRILFGTNDYFWFDLEGGNYMTMILTALGIWLGLFVMMYVARHNALSAGDKLGFQILNIILLLLLFCVGFELF